MFSSGLQEQTRGNDLVYHECNQTPDISKADSNHLRPGRQMHLYNLELDIRKLNIPSGMPSAVFIALLAGSIASSDNPPWDDKGRDTDGLLSKMFSDPLDRTVGVLYRRQRQEVINNKERKRPSSSSYSTAKDKYQKSQTTRTQSQFFLFFPQAAPWGPSGKFRINKNTNNHS